MKNHTEILWQLVNELFTLKEVKQLWLLTETTPINLDHLTALDYEVVGPSISRINCQNSGRYEIPDRDIFRPLQYCGMYFKAMISKENIDDPLWLTRDIVEMSSLHIEGLIKNIGSIAKLPLGAALRNAMVKKRVNPETWKQIDTFTHVYNDAKHNFSHEKDTHMFSIVDAVLSYFVCRKLGVILYPLAKLATDIRIFEKECEKLEKSRIPNWIVDPPDEKVDELLTPIDVSNELRRSEQLKPL